MSIPEPPWGTPGQPLGTAQDTSQDGGATAVAGPGPRPADGPGTWAQDPGPAGPAPASRVAAPRPDGPPALSLMHLGKRFGPKIAVNDLSLAVPAGCLFGLVGPNGAGKTTSLSMATGLLRPDMGRVEVWGHDVWSDPAAAKALMGVLPDGMRLFDRLSGLELIRFCAGIRGVEKAQVEPRAQALLAALGLQADANTLVCDYSAGMTKKIGLACALVHNPRLLVLDEPFEAVDPVSGQGIRQILHDFVRGGGTVVLSSHVMELVENLCDAVAVVAHGQVLAVGPTEQVKAGRSLQERFLELVGGNGIDAGEGLTWLGHSSDSN